MLLPQYVLIPGLLNDADLWRDQIVGLSGAARPLVGDITQVHTLAQLAHDVLATAEERFALAGFSLGGVVALEILRQAPERVTHLALLDTSPLPDDPNRATERQRVIRTAEVSGQFHGFGDTLLPTYLAPRHLRDAGMVGRVRAMTARLGAEVLLRQSLIDRPNSMSDLLRITCPTLVLCGLEDVLTPPSLHLHMAEAIPGSVLRILPDAGHLTPIEQPETVTSELVNLLSR